MTTFSKGDDVRHPVWGLGRVQQDADGENVRVYFKNVGQKVFKLQFANLVRVTANASSNNDIKDKFPRRDLTEEIELLESFLASPDSVSQADKRYLLYFKEQLLKSLDELSELIGSAPTVQIPDFTPWLQFVFTGTSQPEFCESRLAPFHDLERKRHQSYLKYREEYEAIVDSLAADVERQQIGVDRLIDGLEQCVTEQIILEPVKLHWKLLPPGEKTFGQIIAHFERIARQRQDIVVDTDRLNKVHSLRPDAIYIGTDEFEGYLVFYFKKCSKAVLECAVSGNAIYVIRENWEELSRLSKFELLNYHSNKVVRVVHKGNWFGHLRSVLHGPLKKVQPSYSRVGR